MDFDREVSQPGLVRVPSKPGVRTGKIDQPKEGVDSQGLISKSPLIAKSSVMREVMDRVSRVARSRCSVMVLGESGTGKELIARAIHDQSLRQCAPFIPVNCSALPENLLESELFGHRRGAFTGAEESRRGLFEEAEGGTLFLDEIGDMPVLLQSKLLRVLQDQKIRPVGENTLRKVNVRIIAATHQDLGRLIEEGQFRGDLYYRLAVVTVKLPPLRERTEDIPEIAESFIKKYCIENGLPSKSICPKALEKLTRLSWLGNVRELQNTLERALILSRDSSLEEKDFEVQEIGGVAPDRSSKFSAETSDLFRSLPSLKALEKEYIELVLRVTDHAKEKAAKILGVDRKTLYRKLLEFGIRCGDSK